MRPRIWISIDFTPPSTFRSPFDAAFEARTALRDADYVAHLFSVDAGTDFLKPGGTDVVFPIAERCRERPGDPAGLRRALEARGVAVVGSRASVVEQASDKPSARRVIADAGLRVPVGVTLEAGEPGEPGHRAREGVVDRRLLDRDIELVLTSCGLPAVAKPARGPGGSSGVEYLADVAALRWRLRRFYARREQSLLVESHVVGTELTVWVVEGVSGYEVDVAEIDTDGQPLFDRASKTGWTRERLYPDVRTNRVTVRRPPALAAPVVERAAGAATDAHLAFGASSYSRTDMIIRDGVPYVLELNTTPRLRMNSELGWRGGGSAHFGALLGTLVQQAAARAAGH